MSGLISIVDASYISIISVLWYYCVYYGLNPKYSFLMIPNSGPTYIEFYNSLYNNIFIKVIQIVVLLFSLSIVVANSIGHIVSPVRSTLRFLTALTISVFSFEIARFVIFLSFLPFNFIWTGGHINWYNLFSVTNEVKQIQSSFTGGNPINQLIDFLFLSGYFLSTLMLLSMLEIRQALILFLVIVLPFFSILMSFKSTEKIAVMAWKLLIEISIIPFFVLVVLYLSHLVIANFLLQLAFLSLASILPLLLVSNASIFQANTITSLINGLSLESIGNRIFGFSSGISGILSGSASFSDQADKGHKAISASPKMGTALISLSGKSSHSSNIVWDRLREKDFEYRKGENFNE